MLAGDGAFAEMPAVAVDALQQSALIFDEPALELRGPGPQHLLRSLSVLPADTLTAAREYETNQCTISKRAPYSIPRIYRWIAVVTEG